MFIVDVALILRYLLVYSPSIHCKLSHLFFNEVTEVKDDFANWNIVIIFKDCGHSYLFERFHFLKALIHGSESVYR